jgi:hypothetical protein
MMRTGIVNVRQSEVRIMARTNGTSSMMGSMGDIDTAMDRVTRNPSKREGPVARAIEEQTAKLPSDLFLWIAGGSILASLTLKFMGRDKAANWVGEWAPTLLILGLYNKIVKVAGHD